MEKMEIEEILFEYSLKGSGWSLATFVIAGNKFEYQASYTYCILDQIFSMAVDVLERPVKDSFNNYSFTIDEEWRKIDFLFNFEVGQNHYANIKIVEKNNDDVEKVVCTSYIDYYQFIQNAIISSKNILKEFGFIGYSFHWQNDFPLTTFLRTLDLIEDYHNLNFNAMLENKADVGILKTNIYDELNLLCKYLEPEYPIKDIYYYIYKGNLYELENYINEHATEIDTLSNSHYKYTPLICAIKSGMESCSLILIRYGANVNLTDNKQHTTLHFAVQAHSYSLCKKLIEMNKDLVNTPNDYGRTPIFENIPFIKNQDKDSNDYRIFDLLLKNNANILHIAENKVSPLDLIEANQKHYNNNLLDYIKNNYPQIKISIGDIK